MAIMQAYKENLFVFFFPLKSLAEFGKFSWMKFRGILDICSVLKRGMCMCVCKPVRIFSITNISALKLNLTNIWQICCCQVSVRFGQYALCVCGYVCIYILGELLGLCASLPQLMLVFYLHIFSIRSS